MPNILNRIKCHKQAMGSLLSAGVARIHRASPASSLRVHQSYGSPVLFSGLASLVLTPAEIKMIDSHYLKTIQNIQKLHDKTPRCVVLLLAGTLPGEAVLHLKQLTPFTMICHLPGNPINLHARNVLLSSPISAKSWFHQIRSIAVKYKLPSPLYLLDHPPVKTDFKVQVKTAVREYWEELLRKEASELPSLKYFCYWNYNLSKPSTIWTSVASNSFECHKGVVLAHMLSGRTGHRS